MKLFYKLLDVGENDQKKIREEVVLGQKFFAPIKAGFGQYASQTKEREIISLRNLREAHESRKYPDIFPAKNEEVADWNELIGYFPFTREFVSKLLIFFAARYLGKVMFAKMPPGCMMNWHIDPYPIYSGFSRLHIPLFSEQGASDFYTEQGNFSMQIGSTYLYDTALVHTAKNNSNKDRIHLIVDVLLPRENFFNQVSYFWEEIYLEFDQEVNQGSAIEKFGLDYSAEFLSAQKKYGTLLVFMSISSLFSRKIKLAFLWCSLVGRDKFFEQCNLHRHFKVASRKFSSTSGICHWEESYAFVKDRCLDSKVIVCRRDYQ